MRYLPSEKQLKFMNWEYGIFFHFGIRSFNPGHADWDNKDMDINTFNPDALDCEQWAKMAVDAGAKYAILTTKHHDGFANWPTAYSTYSVANTPWKNGKGDVVKEFTDACRKYGLGVGLYYSPAQWGTAAVSFDKPEEYDDYFIHQITELLTGYGKIDYLWFDGCGSGDHHYDEKRIIDTIRGLQPDILIFDMWDPDTAWVGNEEGYAPSPNYYERTMKKLGDKVTGFFPTECDCRLRGSWFYDDNADTIKPVAELVGMYDRSVGRGSNLLLNVGPDNHGRINEADYRRMMEFKLELDRLYSLPLPFGKQKVLDDGLIAVDMPEESYKLLGETHHIPLVTTVVLGEDMTKGQSVKHFRVYATIPYIPMYEQCKHLVYEGNTIGHKAICRFPAIRTVRLSVEIVDAEGEVNLSEFSVYGG